MLKTLLKMLAVTEFYWWWGWNWEQDLGLEDECWRGNFITRSGQIL